MKLVAAYGPAVDSLSEDVVTSLWTEDAVYDSDGLPAFRGRSEVGRLVRTDQHRSWVNEGCAHVMSMPHIEIDGDAAVVTGYSNVFIHQADGWRVHRTAANRWELERTPEGWRVRYRLNRLMNGGAEGRALLERGLKAASSD